MSPRSASGCIRSLTSGLEPSSHKARRAAKAMARRLDKRLAKLVNRANARSGPLQPKLTLEDARRMARGLVGSTLARAQKHCDVKVYALVVMSNHLHLVVQTRKKNLAAFMGDFKARITENLNPLTGRWNI
ncbi:MAG: transposase [Myxococcales bacterium]|nr:transposase [Myxococcales bacterium]